MAGGDINFRALGGQAVNRDLSGSATRTQQEAPPAAVRSASPNPATVPDAKRQSNAETNTLEEYSNEQLREIAGAFGEAVGLINKGVRVKIDESSHRVITQIVDRDTDEVIRQIPPDELLEVSRRLRAFVGTLLDLEI
jgi:flagellar protein FlaG